MAMQRRRSALKQRQLGLQGRGQAQVQPGQTMQGQGMPGMGAAMGAMQRPMMAQGMPPAMMGAGMRPYGQGMQTPATGMQAPVRQDPWAQGQQAMGMQAGDRFRQVLQQRLAQRMSQQDAPYEGTGAQRSDPVKYAQPQAPVDEKRLKQATQRLKDYMSAKSPIDKRIIHAQEWWRQRNWREIERERGTKGSQHRKSATAWLKTSIIGKHSDYMEAYPEPIFLARNQEDEAEAQHLSEIVPVILKKIDFEETYSKIGWQKNIEGTGIYGVTWDGQADNGMGEISIRRINALNIFATPGIEDIQDADNVFCTRMEDNAKLLAMYPQLEGRLGRDAVTTSEYEPLEHKDKEDKTIVVDWYYKKHVNGREVVHYCQYVNDVVLYSSENERPDRGHYDHGLYPFVFDTLLPDAECVYGQGLVDEAKDTQMDIDTINQAAVTNAICNATPRYFMRQDGGINPEQFLDWSIPLIDCNASLGNDTLQKVDVPQMDANTLNFYTSKVEELKTITGNTDVVNGDVPSGVTSGVAIAALREDSGRQSKDANRASYRAMKKLYLMVVELMRQFYTMDRQFRIVGEDGMVSYLHYQNTGLQLQTQMTPYGVSYRMPYFDVDVHVQRENAYTRMALNDLATQFYQMGLFNPMQAPQALSMLQMMEFTGKEKMVRLVQQNFMQTMAQMGGVAPSAPAPMHGGGPVEKGATTPTEEDATEAGTGRNAQAHTPATDRMRQRVADAVRP